VITGSDHEIQAHHVRLFGDGGTGLKPSDFRTVPICAAQHATLHNMGERSFWKANDIDIEMTVMSFMARYIQQQSLSIRAFEALEGVIENG